jgi:biotin operon repressor
MELKPQDIYVASKLFVLKNELWSMQRLGESLGLSASQIHSSIQRLIKAQLIRKDKGYKVIAANLKEFLVHGIRFAFVPELGEPCRGIATASFAPPLNRFFVQHQELPHVWPDSQGEVRGVSLSPLHKHAPKGARNDSELYALLSLIDAVRGGRARERKMAIEHLQRMLSSA